MKKKDRNFQQERGLYTGGWILLALAVLLMAAEKGLHLSWQSFPCLFHKWTGYYCPGCGGTRAVKALLRGHIGQSFLYHPVVLYGAVLYAGFMISHTIEYLTKGRWHTGMRYTDKYLYVGLGMIVVQWVLKNVIKLVWGVGIG